MATWTIHPAGEDAPIQPADYYQRTKYEAEPLVRAVDRARHGDGDPAPGRDLRPRRSRALLHDLQARRQAARSRCSAAAGRSTIRSTSTTWSTRSCSCMAARRGRRRGLSDRRRAVLPIEEIVTRVGRALNVTSDDPALPGLAGGGRRPRLREGLQAVRDHAAHLPAPGRLVPPEPRVRHHAERSGSSATCRDRPGRGTARTGEWYRRAGLSADRASQRSGAGLRRNHFPTRLRKGRAAIAARPSTQAAPPPG